LSLRQRKVRISQRGPVSELADVMGVPRVR
jgi:hypothetical protein